MTDVPPHLQARVEGDEIEVGGARLRLRPTEQGDRACIATRWVRSAMAEQDVEGALWGALVDRLLDSPRTRVAVVCSEASASTILAWACAMSAPATSSKWTARPVLHFAHVDPKLRGFGVGRAVIRRALGVYPDAIDVTHPWPFEGPRYRHDWLRAGALLALGG